MVGKEEDSISWGQYQVSNNPTKTLWRSASWSSSRTRDGKDSVDPNVNSGNTRVGVQRSTPLTPRPQNNCKARSCLPPLQPLSIARRSLDEWPKASSDDIGEWPGPLTPGGRDANTGGERLKLDMSAIQRSSERNGGLVRKDKIAFFDKECSKVAEHIYLGGDAVARDRDILKKNGITHVLNCVGFVCPEYFKSDFVYRTLWLQDSPTEDITSILYDVFDYFEDVREQKGRVFVHCCQGVSRSTSLVIAYLMWREGQSFDDAFHYVKEARGIADPNMGFACQLLQCQKRVHAFPLSPSSLLRMYRIAPHSSYDPLHLVPKMLNDPSPSALDSRGAFIVQLPSTIYIWVGKSCDIIFEREARGAVSQIVHYERVQVPVHVITEGAEPPNFWDSFSKFVIEKSANGLKRSESSLGIPGDRKVNLYDVDFEIFQKAIQGGFVPPASSSEADHETHLPVRENSWSTLRRKFASGHMKDFVYSPRLVLNRYYSDSVLNIARDSIVFNHSHIVEFTSAASSILSSPSSLSLSSSLSSSSLSPPYLSPDSNSSDSSNNSKSFSESPSESLLSLTSTLSTFSGMSLHSSKTTSSVSNNQSNYVEVNFASQPLRSTSSPSKRHVSLAERRGSLSKSLKLPIVSGDGSMQVSCQNYSVDQQVDGGVNDVTCISFELEKGGIIIDSKDVPECINHDSENLSSNLGPFHEESVLVGACDKTTGNDTLNGWPNVSVVLTATSASCKPVQPSVYRLPNLEKISISRACDLDSSSAFLVMVPGTAASAATATATVTTTPTGAATAAATTKYKNIYLRIGKSFGFDQIQIHANRAVGDIELIDWNQVGSDVLSRMGLPEETNIEIIKEGEEPVEFLEVLSTL